MTTVGVKGLIYDFSESACGNTVGCDTAGPSWRLSGLVWAIVVVCTSCRDAASCSTVHGDVRPPARPSVRLSVTVPIRRSGALACQCRAGPVFNYALRQEPRGRTRLYLDSSPAPWTDG